METQFKMVTVTVAPNGSTRLHAFAVGDGQPIDGEIFLARKNDSDWFGFYDWLRTDNNAVIGIRLRIDDGGLDEETLQFLCSLNFECSRDVIHLYFSDKRNFNESFSDDADFGNNTLLKGANGSIAITFNAPSPHVTKQTET